MCPSTPHMHLLRLWSCCSGSVNEQVGLHQEQCTNLNDRFNFLIHCTTFPVGMFKSFAPSTRPQVDRTTGRTLGWRTGPNCNLGNRCSSEDSANFWQTLRPTHCEFQIASHLLGCSPTTNHSVVTHSRPKRSGWAPFGRIEHSPSSVFTACTGSPRHEAPSRLETNLKFRGRGGRHRWIGSSLREGSSASDRPQKFTIYPSTSPECEMWLGPQGG